MKSLRMLVPILSGLLFSTFSFGQTCSISMTMPQIPTSLPQKVNINMTISPNKFVKKIKKDKLHAYFFQRNTGEQGLWHFNSKPDLVQNGYSGTVWLGSGTQGKSQNYTLKVIISKQNAAFNTGPNDIDVVREDRLPEPICDESFSLTRGIN